MATGWDVLRVVLLRRRVPLHMVGLYGKGHTGPMPRAARVPRGFRRHRRCRCPGLAVLIVVEKVWIRGPAAGRLAGVAALSLAIATIWFPWLAPGLHASHMMMAS